MSPSIIFSFLCRNQSQLSHQPPQVAHVPIRPSGADQRVLHLLREHGGHGDLRLRTHVSLLHMRPEAEENVQRLLSHLQETDQGHHQDLPQHMRVLGRRPPLPSPQSRNLLTQRYFRARTTT